LGKLPIGGPNKDDAAVTGRCITGASLSAREGSTATAMRTWIMVACQCACVCVNASACTCVYMCVCMCVRVRVCACMYVCECVYAYV